MLNFTTFRSKEELEKYIFDYWSDDIEVSAFPSEYPCIGFIYMCPDESYDMRFLSKGDIKRMSDDIGV